MKKNIGLICVLTGMLLFFYKTVYCSPTWCDTKGEIAYCDNGDSYSLYFETLPWTDCNGYGLGWTTPQSIRATWTIENEDCELIEKIEADVSETIEIYAKGFIYVTCKVRYTYSDASPKTTSPFPIWFDASGSQCLEIMPPDNDNQIIQPGTPAQTNLYGVNGGVISLQGAKGILVVLDFVNMLPISAIDFEGALVYDLNQCCGSGMYFCYAIFSNPYENVELGVIQI